MQSNDLVWSPVVRRDCHGPSVGQLEAGLLLELDGVDGEDEPLGNVLVFIGVKRTAGEREIRRILRRVLERELRAEGVFIRFSFHVFVLVKKSGLMFLGETIRAEGIGEDGPTLLRRPPRP